MARKNPFKKSSLIDTVISVGVGGAANVAVDYAISAIDTTGVVTEDYKNIGKIAVGAIVGGMVSNKYLRAAVDGIAVVGASNLISGLITSSDKDNSGKDNTPASPSGLAYGTVGRVHLGNRSFRRSRGTHGFSVAGSFGMDK